MGISPMNLLTTGKIADRYRTPFWIYIFHYVKWGECCSLNFGLKTDMSEFYRKIVRSPIESWKTLFWLQILKIWAEKNFVHPFVWKPSTVQVLSGLPVLHQSILFSNVFFFFRHCKADCPMQFLLEYYWASSRHAQPLFFWPIKKCGAIKTSDKGSSNWRFFP